MFNSHLVCDPTIWQSQQQWFLLLFSHRTGTLQCLQKEMATYKHWSVSLWQDVDDVQHCRILYPDKTEWQLISATFCRWIRFFMADQLWFMTRVREEEEWNANRDLHTPYSTVSFQMTSSDLAKYSMTRSVVQSHCDSWASCFHTAVPSGVRFGIQVNTDFTG